MCPCSLRTICHVKVNSSIIIIKMQCLLMIIYLVATACWVPLGWFQAIFWFLATQLNCVCLYYKQTNTKLN